MTTPPSTPLEVLARRLVFVRRHMKPTELHIDNLPHALSEYRATR